MHSDAPSPWVARFAPLVAAGEVLDLACGSGRHARLFAALGHPVLALDRDLAGVGWTGLPSTRPTGAGIDQTHALHERVGGEPAHPTIVTMQHDLEAEGAVWPFAAGRFAGIVVTNYLHRPLLPQLLASLAPDGVLIYETFAAGNEQYGKPSNPAFLLQPGELLDCAAGAGLRVIAYENGFTALPRPALVQRLCAAGPGFAQTAAKLDHYSGQE